MDIEAVKTLLESVEERKTKYDLANNAFMEHIKVHGIGTVEGGKMAVTAEYLNKWLARYQAELGAYIYDHKDELLALLEESAERKLDSAGVDWHEIDRINYALDHGLPLD